MNDYVTTIKYRFLFATIIVLLLAGGLIYYKQYQSILDEKQHLVDAKHAHIHQAYEFMLEELKHDLLMHSKMLLDSEQIIKAVHDQDRLGLQKQVKPFFDLLKQDNSYIKIMTFRQAEGTVILRLHKPEMFGDTIHHQRKIIIDTNKKHIAHYGFEVGKLGMTYRMVTPMFYQDRYIGSLELGVEPNYLLKSLKILSEIKNALLIKKDHIAASLDFDTSKEIGGFYLIQSDPFFLDNISVLEDSINVQEISYDDHLYVINSDIGLLSHTGEPIGKILMAHNIDWQELRKGALQKEILVFTVLLILLLIMILHYGFNYFISRFIASQKELELYKEQLEQKVRERTEEQNVLLSLFDVGSSVLFKWANDDEWSVLHVSQSVTKLLGYETEEFLDNSVSYVSCIHPDDLQRVSQEVEAAIESKAEHFHHEPYRLLTKKGAIKWIYDYTIILRDEKDEIISFVGYATDITEIRQRDKQLLQQSRMAQMGEMISMIAHQWRQPLAAISAVAIDMKLKLELGKYDLQKNENDRALYTDFNQSLDKIDDFVQTLSCTIDDFRNFHKSDKNPIFTSIEKPLKKALSIIESSFSNYHIEIKKEFHSTKQLAMFDSELMQVILNLLKNAHDNFLHRKTEQPCITIISCDTDNGIILTIQDNGGGIPSDIIENIFDPYFSTKDEKNGTGLGLYMSKTIVEEHHNGSLKAINCDDGACFVIEINSEKDLCAS